MKRYLFNILKALNRLGNTLLGGHPEIPMSARAGYWVVRGYRGRGKFAWFIDKIFRNDNHCRNAYMREDDNMQRLVADPEGRYFWPLLAFWMAVIGWLVWVHVA